MDCTRCSGQMKSEFFMDRAERAIPWSYEGWRCVLCGEVVDPVILMNRSLRGERLAAVARAARIGRRSQARA